MGSRCVEISIVLKDVRMPKVGVAPIRRKALIDATISTLHLSKLSDPTLAEISKRAGLSTSIVNHYFKSKKKLLEATMRELASGFIGEVALRTSAASTPLERINAVIDGNLASSQCVPEVMSAWLWFWARVPVCKEYAEIQHACDQHVENELRIAVKELVSDEEVEDVVQGIVAIMYGLWLRYTHNPKLINVEKARRITKDLVACRVSQSQPVS